MNRRNGPLGYPPSIQKNEAPPGRSFASPGGEISGKSVVLGGETAPVGDNEVMWPCSLSDFLKDYQGRTVLLEYALPNGSLVRRRGVIKVAGTNFVGIRPEGTKDLLLVDLSSVKSIAISDYGKRP